MAAQYSTRHFFRKVPIEALLQYFATKSFPLKIDEKNKKISLEMIQKAWDELPDKDRLVCEAEFQDINALACEGGIAVLIDEANFKSDKSFTETITSIEGFHAKVMWAFLEKPEYWRGASMFLHADNVSPSYWKKRNDLPKIAPCVDTKDIQALAKAISEYFNKKEGRGKNCIVEPYRRNNKEYFFAYPEDFAQSNVEWVGNALKSQAHYPAFEIIFVYSESEGSLDIYAPKNTKALKDLQKLFALHILKLPTLEDGKIDKRVYELAPVIADDFKFKIEPTTDIKSVAVTRLRISYKGNSKKRLTLEADTHQDHDAVNKFLEELKIKTPYYVSQVTLKVIFDSIVGKRAKNRIFNITHPNSCALNHDGNDLKIRQMLTKSGIEPQESKS